MRDHILHRFVLQSVNVEVADGGILSVFDRGMNHEDIGYPQIQKEAVHHGAIRNAVFVDKEVSRHQIIGVVVGVLFDAHYRFKSDVHQSAQILDDIVEFECFLSSTKCHREYIVEITVILNPLQSLHRPPSVGILPFEVSDRRRGSNLDILHRQIVEIRHLNSVGFKVANMDILDNHHPVIMAVDSVVRRQPDHSVFDQHVVREHWIVPKHSRPLIQRKSH